MKRLLLPIAIACASSVAQAGTLSFSETEWAPADVIVTTLSGPAGGQSGSASSLGYPDNSGPALRVTTVNNSTVFTGVLIDGWTIDMSAQSIDSIDWELRYRWIVGAGDGQAFGLLIEQDGAYYSGSYNVTGSGNSDWQSQSRTGLTQSDFGLIFGTLGPAAPDFSAGAADISLGFYSANSGGLGRTVDYDNLSFAVETTPIPLPAGLPLALVGLGGLYGLRRCQRKRAGV